MIKNVKARISNKWRNFDKNHLKEAFNAFNNHDIDKILIMRNGDILLSLSVNRSDLGYFSITNGKAFNLTYFKCILCSFYPEMIDNITVNRSSRTMSIQINIHGVLS